MRELGSHPGKTCIPDGWHRPVVSGASVKSMFSSREACLKRGCVKNVGCVAAPSCLWAGACPGTIAGEKAGVRFLGSEMDGSVIP